ncbi:MAG TPA: hypothetical protein VGZ22_16995, partial [Isosphaeraceae bacterium]|nr:hypothetical protein [Isosphaeraceae bacterium]
IGDDHSVSLWDVAAKWSFTTLRPPSPVVARVFVDEVKLSDNPTVQLDARFWEIIGPLLPRAAAAKK